MNIQHTEDNKNGEFYYEVDGRNLASMTYTYAGDDKIIIDHTSVDESLKGQGVGYKLVETAVNFAREKNIKIMPLCPFANAVFNKRSKYSDVRF
ncbi:MAG: N-acetyltransferase [Winogradskyella sp.]|uniref:GNAT family N-acetyltransferase n=1 Tax=Winogradskyella sp. TaxID=1883156 RepID=UPI0025F1483F|nr:GNAT family N-acetyltransferase [Winogradskyella sp.]NRB59024.1 N-acetyltransferase [Winogradskyella sp.]